MHHPRVAAFMLIASCASTPSNPAELGEAVVDAIRDGDRGSFDRLHASAASLGKVCERGVGEVLVREHLEARRAFTHCRRALDWSRVRAWDVFGGVAERPMSKCGGRVLELSDIWVAVELSGPSGPELHVIDIGNPLSLDDGHHLGGDLECRAAPEGLGACREIVRATVARSSREIGDAAHEVTGSLLTTCVGLAAPRRDRLAQCVAAAPDLDGLDACYMASFEADDADDPSIARRGSATCERFLTFYAACVEELPEESQPAIREGLAQMRETFRGTQSPEHDAACRQALDAAGSVLGELCPKAWSDVSRQVPTF